MKNLLIFFALLLLMVGCNSPSELLALKKQTNQDVARVKNLHLPMTEHGYSNLKAQTIRSQKQLDALITRIKQQVGWSKPGAVIAVLQDAKVDFRKHAIVFFFHHEPSSMIHVTLGEPEWDKHDNSINIHLFSREMKGHFMTTDMAYHGYAFVVDKDVDSAIFNSHLGRIQLSIRETKQYPGWLRHALDLAHSNYYALTSRNQFH